MTLTDSPLPSVAQVWSLPELQAGAPELAAGAAGLDRTIRWVHVASDSGIAGSVDGGELVLMTATAWPSDQHAQARFTDDLIAAGVTAIALELGRGLDEVPQVMIASCDAHRVPLIVFQREVRFVQITQRVHQLILDAHTAALEARSAVHEMLTELGLNRSPVDYVVERLAATLNSAVVLEDSAHRVVAFTALHDDAATVLEPWQRTGAPQLPAHTDRVPVEARGTRWGYLTALAGPPHPAGRQTVLELGAFALALGRLADREGDQWMQLGSKRAFEAILSGRYRNDTELAAQLTAAGLPVEGRVLLAATLRGHGDFGSHRSLEHATLETALRRAVAPEGRVLIADDPRISTLEGAPTTAGDDPLLALISFAPDDARAGHLADRRTPSFAARLARELDMLVPESTPVPWRAHLALGAPTHRLRSLVASLEQLRTAGRLAPAAEIGRVAVQQVEHQPLAHLVRSLTSSPELQQFTTDLLGPLILHDRSRGAGHPGDLLEVLSAYTAHPTNRSLAAQQARLSRSVFYQRLELIEQLLGVDLTDGETIAALTVALLAHHE